MNSFQKKRQDGRTHDVSSVYEEWKKANQNTEKPAYFVSANDLTPLEHAQVQAVAQEYIDSSISKTVNAPNSHTVNDVKNLYMVAYDLVLKAWLIWGTDRAKEFWRVVEKKEEPKTETPVKWQPKPVVPRPMSLSA